MRQKTQITLSLEDLFTPSPDTESVVVGSRKPHGDGEVSVSIPLPVLRKLVDEAEAMLHDQEHKEMRDRIDGDATRERLFGVNDGAEMPKPF